LHHRITGLSAEAAFWALLSPPPLALGTVGALGYLHGVLGPVRGARLERDLTDAASALLSALLCCSARWRCRRWSQGPNW
jgi:membrane protein